MTSVVYLYGIHNNKKQNYGSTTFLTIEGSLRSTYNHQRSHCISSFGPMRSIHVLLSRRSHSFRPADTQFDDAHARCMKSQIEVL